MAFKVGQKVKTTAEVREMWLFEGNFVQCKVNKPIKIEVKGTIIEVDAEDRHGLYYRVEFEQNIDELWCRAEELSIVK